MAKRIEKLTRESISSNKYKAGIREVITSVKGSKLIIISESVGQKMRKELEDRAASLNVPLYHFKGSSLQLARMCGVPYKISAISLKTGNVEDVNIILQDKE